MSENGDSFEKIEPSALNAPTSDQGTVTLSEGALNNQHSSPANTMNSSPDQAKITQVNELEFELEWETKNAIVNSLSQHTALLSGLIVKEDTRENIRKANNDLVTTLMNLPLKVDRSKSFESVKRSEDEPNEMVVDLDWKMRSKIVDALMINHQTALKADHIASELKSKQVDQNNELAFELLKLRPRTIPSRSVVRSATNEAELNTGKFDRVCRSSFRSTDSDFLCSQTVSRKRTFANCRPSSHTGFGFGTSSTQSSGTSSTQSSGTFKFSLGTTSTNLPASTSTAPGGFLNSMCTPFKFNPLPGSDVVIRDGKNVHISTRHQCITCMKEYATKSLEELRYEDYQANRKGITSTMFGLPETNQPASSPFGLNPATFSFNTSNSPSIGS